ncbi:MAG: SET domain-containing protein-lysine N-methyltransferase [Gemmatimonadota bacterium]|nr:SET domain-containing protein-lysine N-methyltransferase [Gemmatimonadota bacterium]MDZ4863824.1 SET domain-containing protein-lysine N-methyltransferase [Gemmatimonadota bacterium]
MSLAVIVSPESAPVVVRNDAIKGRGLFAARAIAEDEVIEMAPVAIIDAAQASLLEETPLGHHYFHWDGDEDWRGAVAFGLVSLVNHAETANAGVWPDYERQCMILAALRPIAEGEEITIHYDIDLWFDAH